MSNDKNKNNSVDEKDARALVRASFADGTLEKIPDETVERYYQLAEMMTGGGADAFDEMDREWRPPMVRAVQAMSSETSGKPENAKIGDLFHKGGSLPKPFIGVVAYVWPSRIAFEPGENRPFCSSENVDTKGRGANDKSVSVYGDSCATCPFDQQPFRHGKTTNCSDTMNFLVVPEDLSNIYVIPFSKSAYSNGKNLLEIVTARRPPWSRFFSFDTTVEKRKQGGGQFAVLKASAIDDKTKPVPQHLQDFVVMLRKHFSTMRDEMKTLQLQRSSSFDEAADSTDASTKKVGGAKTLDADYSDTM